MTATTGQPTTPGYYWRRWATGSWHLVYLEEDDLTRWEHPGGEGPSYSFANDPPGTEYAGPILPPGVPS